MKKAAFILASVPVMLFSQQSFLFTKMKSDSLAQKNVNSVLHYAKKSFNNSSFSSNYVSEVSLNVSELLRNTYNFNTVNHGLFEGEHTLNYMHAFPNRATSESPPAVWQGFQIKLLDN